MIWFKWCLFGLLSYNVSLSSYFASMSGPGNVQDSSGCLSRRYEFHADLNLLDTVRDRNLLPAEIVQKKIKLMLDKPSNYREKYQERNLKLFLPLYFPTNHFNKQSGLCTEIAWGKYPYSCDSGASSLSERLWAKAKHRASGTAPSDEAEKA